MAAYIIGHINVRDAEKFARYREKVPAVVAKYGGSYKVRGGAMEALEGEAPSPRIVVIEFDDAAAARRWYASEDYAPLIALRQSASDGALLLVEGV